MTYLIEQPWIPVTYPPPPRSPERLLEVVAAAQLETCERYSRRDISGDGKPETFCNKFVSDATRALACGVPDVFLVEGRWRELQVLHQRDWLCNWGPRHGWERLSSAHVAQAMADQGQVAVALWQGPSAAHGHIALVVPSQGQPGTWIAQAGASNFSRGTLAQGFGSYVVELFGHP